MSKLIFWEINEINFDYLEHYIAQGKLPSWRDAIERFGVTSTVSEQVYEQIEPWIQWPTVRTGKDYSEHQVFRLGDIEVSDVEQYWETLECEGYSVAAVSPINGANRTKNSPFWIPDPWVDTPVSGSGFAHRITRAVRQAVNDNSEEKLTLASLLAVLEGLLTHGKVTSWPVYLKGVLGALKKQHWSKAIVLDRLLADIFITEWKKHRPDFSVLFLNSGAHVQHHYMCNSSAYAGEARNPEWYVPKSADPLLEMLEMYDGILADLLKLPDTRLMIGTGMRQVPYEDITYYWRLRDHGEFLNKIGIPHKRVQPRMTRDFLVEFESVEQAAQAEERLKQVVSASNGRPLFEEVDNRGDSLFVTFTWPHDIDAGFQLQIGEETFPHFEKDVVFVAIKNAHHDTQGYFMDSASTPDLAEDNVPLKTLHGRVLAHFGL